MSITDYINSQAPERKDILTSIHKIIISADKKAEGRVDKMMGKEMIIYLTDGIFKYALSGVKEHMSLHIMPIYGSPELHEKYKKLLTKAKFQKGCINFRTGDEMPLDIVRSLLNDTAKIDMAAFMERFKKKSEK